MTLGTLWYLPVKDKLTSDTLDLITDQDFELDLRITSGSAEQVQMAIDSAPSYFSPCLPSHNCSGTTCNNYTCYSTCSQYC